MTRDPLRPIPVVALWSPPSLSLTDCAGDVVDWVGPALAQAAKTHAVTLRLTAWETDSDTPATSRIAKFTLSHR